MQSRSQFAAKHTGLKSRKSALAGTSAVGVALLSAALLSAPARAGCSFAGGVETCTGDLSGAGGIHYTNGPVSTLDVNSLTTADIAPGSGVFGIGLTGGGGSAGGGGNGASFPVPPFYIPAGNGDGGATGPANTINFNSGSPFELVTSGNAGIYAFSLGQGGGSGGDFNGLGGNAGDGGAGGDGGWVLVTSSGNVKTSGANAAGILAVSSGGGGGTGGSVHALGGGGGSGGAGGRGGSVEVDLNDGTIITGGNNSAGIAAQSYGGGGGAAGGGVGLFYLNPGSGTGAGNGGSVLVKTLAGTVISTVGNDSHGILAQSIGGFGGGGAGGGGLVVAGGDSGTGGDGGTVTVNANSLITTHGTHAYGIFAESIGGGGGDGGTAGGLVALGSSGGGGGGASAVNVTNLGSITTTGIHSVGIAAFSIGGGGGDGGPSGGLVALGGTASDGSPGGTVTVINSGEILTEKVESNAIFAQSIGGGGGNGNLAGGLVAIGGGGSGGGAGGTVSVTNTNSLTTFADRSNGIFAQSVGGGGGNGGSSGGFIAVGGSGSATSKGGAVTVNNSGTISVAGGQSYAILAQSVGGGGGNGGSTGGMFSVGGQGGAGGDGDIVSVINTANLTTNGLDSAALLAQSVGGGGGNGGNAVAVGAFVAVSIGGKGGVGGTGGVVHVNCTSASCSNLAALGGASIKTYQGSSTGILAQSVGGGGGNGGFSVSAAIGLYGSASFGLGGSGGAGGNASEVVAGAKGSIETHGAFSNGIEAESVGGGGGDGGFSISASASTGGALSLGFGGKGGAGGSAGTVTLDTLMGTGTSGILTTGDFSTGVFAASIGGGGGNGGFAISGAVSPYASAALGFGGDAGAGGAGKDVSVATSGDITTQGNFSNGITAESIGGGGGNGGFSIAVSASEYAAGALSFGGDGATGANGGNVTVHNAGFIKTSGLNAYGIMAQSVGGGGGNGGFAAGLSASLDGIGITYTVGGKGASGADGHSVTVTTAGGIMTSGDLSAGIFAQSVGGGGGAGGFSIGAALSSDGIAGTQTVGGKGGSGGLGGNVSVDVTDSIRTSGNLADGIVAQSVGGGGGKGGFSIGASVSLDSSAAATSIGGLGGSGHDAGTVLVTTRNDIVTTGIGSNGIFAQSVGGGGGSGGFSIAGSFSFGGKSNATSTGGDGGTAGDGNTVTVHKLGGTIETAKANANAIFAQSVGGGGGNGGFSIAGSISDDDASATTTGGKGNAAGRGGTVEVTNIGDLSTTGAFSDGILAQSIGGGGGNGGWSIGGSLSVSGGGETNTAGGSGGASGIGGDVTVTSNGNITTSGAGSVGILAQSVGGGGGNGGFSGGLSIGIGGGATTNAIGGDGGGVLSGANSAGTVTITTTLGNIIATSGNNATAVIAQSIGGGGGNGGFSAALSGSEDDAAASSVGGKGGLGQDGNTVTVHNFAQLSASGALSDGILAQSVGGGGGNGGFSLAGSLSTDSDGASSSVGGKGGAGGKGGQVHVDNHANIVIGSAALPNSGGSVGILAQSIGGGGGNGGFSGALTISIGGSATTNSVGGDGGDGSDADTVTVSNAAGIETWAANSSGILAQSVGGSGGNGGFSISAAGASDSDGENQTVGGSGAKAAAGGDVFVSLAATSLIITNGDLSYGVLAQSVGGGGGNGGFAIGGTLSLGGDSSSNVTGGSGAGGGKSGIVDVNNLGAIYTLGRSSIGIFAQSVGGGGGSGGFAGGLSISTGGDAKNSVGGGSGSGGGDGGQVTVENGGLIQTARDNSIGILAQSVGGGGGNGAFSIAGSGGTGDGSNNSVGGAAAGGGNGGFVHVINSGRITTQGALSYGILAQSVGGGGGNGGFSIEGTLASGSGGNSQSVGGAGGSGGSGGDVQVDNTGSIVLQKSGSVGVLAQSVGGGGGTGGFNGSLNLSGGSVGQTVGGSGGVGGNGGNVTVNSTGNITTLGANSIGVLAQSIGGGGGYGGINVAIATGDSDGTSLDIGSRSSGGSNGTVTVQVTGNTTVQTGGALSDALLAQGIGGGGGFGGLAVDDPLTLGAAGATLFLGAHGAGGGNGTATSPTNSNNLITTGAGSLAAVAQSIGGGGGQAGQSGDYDLGINTLTLTTTLGGDSSSGGNGDSAILTNTGNITTTNENAIALLSQSIGGGGGVASFSFGTLTGNPLGVVEQLGGSEKNGGNGALARVTTTGTTQTSGALAAGLLVQSIGGGGGFGSLAVQSGIAVGGHGFVATLGATGGAGGTGNAADAEILSGSITTTGHAAPAVVAQSIGGGGGFAANYGVAGPAIVNLGASGGAGGDAGIVTVNSAAGIVTSGTDSPAIVAQSIGGGGGLFLGVDTAGAPIATRVEPMTGGSGGSGATVTVNNTAAIATSGTGAAGIIAQSIGGGGGLVGGGQFASSIPVAGSFAGTVGGTGTGGQVAVTTSANILTSGPDAIAIMAQSQGGSGQSDIRVVVTAGVTVSGGTGLGHAVSLYGGLRNIVSNSGMLLTQPLLTLEPQNPLLGQSAAQNAILNTGIEEFVITGTFGDDVINNAGKIYGNVNLELFGPYSDINPFNNAATGYFAPGNTVILGSAATTGNRLSNAGTVSPGDFYNILTTNLTGNLSQTSTGTYLNDLDLRPDTADRINATGAASLSGAVMLSFNNPGWARPGTWSLTIVSAAGGRGGSTFTTLVSPPSAVFTPSLTYPNATDANLSYAIDFSPSGLTGNQHSVGYAVNGIQTAGVPAFRIVAAELFFIPTVPLLGKTYDSLSGEGVTGIEQAIFYARNRFFDATMQNASFALGADSGPYALGNASVSSGRWRFWISGHGGSGYDSARPVAGSAKNDYGSAGGQIGIEYRIDDNALFGFTGGGDQANFNVRARETRGHGVGANFGIYGMAMFSDNTYVSGILSYGHYNNYEQRSNVGVGLDATHPWTYINQPLTPIPVENTEGKFESNTFGGQLEAGWKHAFEDGNLTPFLNIQFDNQWVGKFDEKAVVTGTTTPGILGLNYKAMYVPSVPLTLGIQGDTTFDVGGGMKLMPVLRLGWRHEFETERPVQAGFEIAPGFDFKTNGAESFRDSLQVDTALVFQVTNNVVMFANFAGNFSHGGSEMSGTGGLKIRF